MPTFPSTDQDYVAWSEGRVHLAGATDVGRLRRINQDAFAYFHQAERNETLLVVADGLGGHRGGEVASRLAVEAVGQWIGEGDDEPAIRLSRAITTANRKVLAAARKDRTLDGMGTTLVCLLLTESGPSYVAHVGDSRLYRLRGERLAGITEDHSLVVTLIRDGILSSEDAREDPRRNQVLRAVGIRDEVEIEIAPLEPRRGDIYLLCSDGLHGLIEDHEIQRLVAGQTEPEATVAALIDAANKAGGADNITCLIAALRAPRRFSALRTRAERLWTTTRSLFGKKRAG